MKFCPECGTKVEGMKFCPECGYKIDEKFNLTCPEFPSDMGLGKKQLISTLGNYTRAENDLTKLGTKLYTIQGFSNGIGIAELSHLVLELHYSQIISIEQFTGQDIKNKSVVGRGVVGLAIGGPLGAIVGGISGVGNKTKNKFYLLIKYWDRETKKPVAISFEYKKSFDLIINYYNRALKAKKSHPDSKDLSHKEFVSTLKKRINTKLVGVTSENDDGTNRQELLMNLKEDDCLDIFEVEIDGQLAYEVRDIYDNVVGFISKSLADSISEVYGSGVYLELKKFEVTGGSEKYYGCNITLDIFKVEPKQTKDVKSIDHPDIDTPASKPIDSQPQVSHKKWIPVVALIAVVFIVIIVAVIGKSSSRDKLIENEDGSYTYGEMNFEKPYGWTLEDQDQGVKLTGSEETQNISIKIVTKDTMDSNIKDAENGDGDSNLIHSNFTSEETILGHQNGVAYFYTILDKGQNRRLNYIDTYINYNDVIYEIMNVEPIFSDSDDYMDFSDDVTFGDRGD